MLPPEQFYIVASSSPIDERTRVLKHGETFGVFDLYGDILVGGMGEHGIYHEGTRFLSMLVLTLFKKRPLLLSSTITEDNRLLTVDLTNPDVYLGAEVVIPRGTLHIRRTKLIWRGVCYERVAFKNYGLWATNLAMEIEFGADFVDIFQVRGMKRTRSGEFLDAVAEERGISLSYQGLDGLRRRTKLVCSLPPQSITSSAMRFTAWLEPNEALNLTLTVSSEVDSAAPKRFSFENALGGAKAELARFRTGDCHVLTSNEQFNELLDRSAADLHMMVTQTALGPYPYAGVPWFNTAFGRDGLITGMETLWFNPELARGVLSFLAATQAKQVLPEQEAEPGKILHETRKGEMAALKEIPFGQYYGTVDATPLFVMLAGAYHRRTGDLDFIASIWENIELALRWIDEYGDADRDGFVEYNQGAPKGLIHQGWKDSHDAIFHQDGMDAKGPIALCEVQGYVYEAKRWASVLATLLGRRKQARELLAQAERLQERFEAAFWCEELSTYALALDGDKRPCQVRTSNPGHCLFTGIISPERAGRLAQTLMQEDSFSGWGIRTLASSEARYNPMSYHNGSIWPHDNALIAAGLARYGFKQPVLQILTGLFDASVHIDLHRLPELFCGFPRHPDQSPTAYPVACSPQSWASAATFLLLESCLGLSVDAPNGQITFAHPVLPHYLDTIEIKNLRVGDAALDLIIHRYPEDVGINVVRREGRITVTTIK